MNWQKESPWIRFCARNEIYSLEKRTDKNRTTGEWCGFPNTTKESAASSLLRQDFAVLSLKDRNTKRFCSLFKNLLLCHSNSISEVFPFLLRKADADWSRYRHLQWRWLRFPAVFPKILFPEQILLRRGKNRRRTA